MPSEARDLEWLELEWLELADPSEPDERRRRPALRAVESVGAESSPTWLAELADLPAHLIGDLPVPTTVRMRAVDGSAFHVSSSSAQRAVLEEAGAIVLDRDEWAALVLATEADRAWPADLVRALRVRGTSGRLSLDGLLDGITAEQARRDSGRLFSMGRVLGRIGARLDAVRMDVEVAS